MQTLLVRALSGIVFLVIMAGGILFNQYTFGLLMSVLLVGGLREFYAITSGKRESMVKEFFGKRFVILSAVVVYWLSFVLMSPPMGALPDGSNLLKSLVQLFLMQRDSALPFSTLVPILIFVFFIIELYNKSENPFANIGWNALAIVYLLIPILLTNKIYFEYGGVFLLALFSIIWFYDSACYAFGSLFGKRKLFERISPKKTVEGSIGGLLTTLVAAYFINKITGLDMLNEFQWIALAFMTTIVATFGDLAESLLKRSAGVKDSGNIMPGHGGFLDRFDAYLLAVPFVSLMLWIFVKIDAVILLIKYMG
jgi:phosphatidate cytidylyltransferase